VLELAHPGKPQGLKKTICALASDVGIGLPRSGRTVQNTNASVAAAMTGGAKLGIDGILSDGLARRRGRDSRP
jgi:hypothetical protein